MKTLMEKSERLLELGGTKKDIALLAIGGIALVCSLLKWQPLPFDLAWIAVVLCGVPIVLEAIIGLVTAFDIKADVLVSLALIASVCISEIFAAGEVAFIMQLGGLLEELTVAKARAGIEKLVHLTPQTARGLAPGSDDAALYRLAASAEQLSEHPLGKAITASYRQSGGTPMAAAEGFQMVTGRGVCATVDDRRVLVGNTELLAIIGTLDPVIGALVHNAGSVLVITNSALLLNRRRSSWQSPSSASSSAQ